MSPFQSEQQRRWMWVHKPDLAQEWADKYGSKPKAKPKPKAKKKKAEK